MTDDEIDRSIAIALALPEGAGVPVLAALRDRIEAERGAHDPALARTWDALVRAASRSPDDLALYLRHAEDRARWLMAVRGPAHAETIAAWDELGEAADAEMIWDVAARAFEAIIDAPAEPETRTGQLALSRALRSLGARRLSGRDLAAARRLFERDLVLGERLYGDAPAQLAISLDNLALVLERLGELAPALALRHRQRDMLAAAGASADQLAAVDRHIARLSGA